MGKMQGREDGGDVVARNDLTEGLRATKDMRRPFGLLEHGVSGRQAHQHEMGF